MVLLMVVGLVPVANFNEPLVAEQDSLDRAVFPQGPLFVQ